MKPLASYFFSTIGRKQIVGLTGLGLTLFVIVHATGNFLLFVGPEAYNLYSHKLTSNPLIYLAEVGLLALFALHLATALKLALENWGARTQRYAVSASKAKATSPVAKTLWLQGVIIAIFVVLHLITFKYGPGETAGYVAAYNGLQVRDLFRLVVEVFKQPEYVILYAVAMVILGLHLSHGVGSSLQTFGLIHPKHNDWIRRLSWFVALYVTLGFLSQPIYIFFVYKN